MKVVDWFLARGLETVPHSRYNGKTGSKISPLNIFVRHPTPPRVFNPIPHGLIFPSSSTINRNSIL